MLLIACSLALLVIYAGMKLLAQTNKETLSNLFKYVSWFLVIMGFFMLLCIAAFGVMRCCHKGQRMMDMESKFRMMEEKHHGNACMMKDHMGSSMMMHDCQRKMGGCCGGMMNGGCSGGEMEGGCGEHKGYHEKMDGECNRMKEGCDENSELCHTKKGDICKKDSVKKK